MPYETERLRLVPYAAEHFLALIDGVEKFHESFGFPAADGLREFIASEDVSEEFLTMLRSSTGENPWHFGFAIIDKGTECAIGNAGFKGPPDDEGVVEIAYGVVPDFEGKGFATEAAGQLVCYAADDSSVRLIRAHTLPEENASTRVLTKNGFKKIGVVEDPEDGTVWCWERNP